MTWRRPIVVGACGVAAAITLIGVSIAPADLGQWNAGSVMLWPADHLGQVIPGFPAGGLGTAAWILFNVVAWSLALLTIVAFPWKALGRALKPSPVPSRKLGVVLGLLAILVAAATSIYVLKASHVFLKDGGCFRVSVFYALLMVPLLVGMVGLLAVASASSSERVWWAATAVSTIIGLYSLVVVYGWIERIVFGRGSYPCGM